MALVQTVLKTALVPIFTPATFPSSSTDAANKWADAYKGYASAANSCAANTPNPASLTAARNTLQAALLAAFNAGIAGSKTTAQIATDLSTAFQNFWLLPPMVGIFMLYTPSST